MSTPFESRAVPYWIQILYKKGVRTEVSKKAVWKNGSSFLWEQSDKDLFFLCILLVNFVKTYEAPHLYLLLKIKKTVKKKNKTNQPNPCYFEGLKQVFTVMNFFSVKSNRTVID